MIAADSRFPTGNTNLAACLGALKIPIKTHQPCMVCIDAASGKRSVTWFFELAGEDFLGERHQCREIDWAWRNREVFERDNPGHPLTPMRAALEKLEWLTLLWHGRVRAAESEESPVYATRDIHFAAAMMTSGEPLVGFDSPEFRFARRPPRRALKAWRDYNTPTCEGAEHALMRRALEVRKILLSLIKRPDCIPVVRHTAGEWTGDGGADAYIPVGTPKDEVDRILDILHSI